jgi:AsmA protein
LTLSEVDVSADLRSLLSRRIEDAEVSIADSRIEMPLPFGLPQRGTAEGGSPATNIAPPVSLVSVRAITLRDVRIVSRGREIVLSADSALRGSELVISRFSATAGGMSLEAQGQVTLDPRVEATLEARASDLDLDALLSLVSAFSGDGSESGPQRGTSTARIAATLSAPTARAAGITLTALTASVVAEGDRITIEPFEFGVFDGKFAVALDADAGDTLDATFRVDVTDVDVAALAAYGGSEGAVSGRMSASGRVTARGTDFAELLAAAQGSGKVSIGTGTIRGLDLARTVVLFFGRPAADAPPSTGARFDSIAAAVALKDGVVRSDDLTMRSPDMDLSARGTLDLRSSALDARADLILSESLSAQAGTDLYRYTREGNRVVLPAAIGGTLEAPRVSIDAAAAIKRGIGNELRRRLGDLFKSGR